MIRSVSGHSFSAEPVIRARPCSPVVTTAAAAPSPNKAVATIAAGSSLSSRIEIEQVSTVTNSQWLPGSAAASRAVERQAVDPAGAAEAEHRHAADVAAQAEPRADARFEAGGGDAGGRDGDDAVDLVRGRGRPWRSPPTRPRRTDASAALEIDARCARASRAALRTSRSERRCGAWRCRHCRTRPTAGRTRLACRRTPASRGLRVGLLDDVRRNRGGQRE